MGLNYCQPIDIEIQFVHLSLHWDKTTSQHMKSQLTRQSQVNDLDF